MRRDGTLDKNIRCYFEKLNAADRKVQYETYNHR